MLLILIAATLVSLVLTVLARTFGAAALGGAVPFDASVAFAAALVTVVSRRVAVPWIVSCALVAEVFSRLPYGVAATGVLAGLVAVRFFLFSVFSHRSVAARAACVVIGCALFGAVLIPLRVAFAFAAGSVTAATMSGIMRGSATVAAATAALSLVLVPLVSVFARLLRPSAGARGRRSYAFP